VKEEGRCRLRRGSSSLGELVPLQAPLPRARSPPPAVARAVAESIVGHQKSDYRRLSDLVISRQLSNVLKPSSKESRFDLNDRSGCLIIA